MTKKITKEELQQIIVEEIKQTLNNEGLGDWITKGIQKLKSPFAAVDSSEKEAEKTVQPEPSLSATKLNNKRVLEISAQLFGQFASDLIKNPTFKKTKIYKVMIEPLKEVLLSQLEKQWMKDFQSKMKEGKITIQDLYDDVRLLASDKSMKPIINALAIDVEEVFDLANLQKQKIPFLPPVEDKPESAGEVPAPVKLPPAPVKLPPAPVKLPPAPVKLPPAPVKLPPAPVDFSPLSTSKPEKKKTKIKKATTKTSSEKPVAQPKRKLASLESQIEAAKTKDSLEAMKEKIMKIKDQKRKMSLGLLYNKKSQELEKKKKKK